MADLVIMPSRKKAYRLTIGFILLFLSPLYFTLLYGAIMLDGDTSLETFFTLLFTIIIPIALFKIRSAQPQHTFSFFSDHVELSACRIVSKNTIEPRPMRPTVGGVFNFLFDFSAKARFTKHTPLDYRLAVQEQPTLTVFYKDIRKATFKVAGFSELVKTKHLFAETTDGPLMLQHIDYADVQKIADFLKSKGVEVLIR